MYVSSSLNKFKPLIIIFIGVLIVLAVIPFLFWNNALVSLYIHSLIPIISFSASIIIIYTTWRSYKNQKDVFRPWLLIALGMLSYGIANLLYFIFEDVMGNVYVPSIADICYLAVYPFFITGMLLFLKRPFNIRLKSLLDIAIVMVSAFFIVWFPLVWPIVEPSQPDTLSMILSLFYIFLDIIILFVVLTLLFNQNKKISELPIVLISLGLFFQIFGDMIYAYYAVEPSLLYEWLFNVLFALNMIFIALAALSFLKNIQADLDYLISSYKRSSAQNDLISYLPLMLVLFTYSLLIITTPDEALIWGVGIVVVMVILRQIVSSNELKRAQITLKMNKELISQKNKQLSFITTNMMDLIIESDKNGIFQYISPSSHQLLGYSPRDLLGKSFPELIHPDDLGEIMNSLNKSVASQGSVRLQYRCKHAAGNYLWMETMGKPVFEDAELKGFIYSTRDITEQIESAEFVKESLREKETLLREIHHRVHNNLQIITSLLNIQSKNVVDKRDHELFVVSQNRVHSLAMIHEKLYQSENLSSINFSDYLKTLLNSLIYNYPENKVHLELDTRGIELNIETSVPCGLIITELVSNSLKYAFPLTREGKITVKMHQEGEKYVLIVGDNGIGYQEESDLYKPTLGLNLVNLLVGQLDGNMEVLEEKGIVYRITFQELKYEQRI